MADDLSQRLARLEAESDIRRLAARYMALCDEPMTEAGGLAFDDLFTDDVIWEGIGIKAGKEFDRVEGRDNLIAWFDTMRTPPKYKFNVHYLTSESITTGDSQGHGTWVMFQLAHRTSGEGEVRLSRLTIEFREVDKGWRIAHFQTQSLLRQDIAAAQIATWLGELST